MVPLKGFIGVMGIRFQFIWIGMMEPDTQENLKVEYIVLNRVLIFIIMVKTLVMDVFPMLMMATN